MKLSCNRKYTKHDEWVKKTVRLLFSSIHRYDASGSCFWFGLVFRSDAKVGGTLKADDTGRFVVAMSVKALVRSSTYIMCAF